MTTRMRLRVALLTLLVGSACAGSGGDRASAPVTAGQSEVRVEVYQGLQGGTIPDPELDLLIDVTPLVGPGETPAPGADLTPLAESFAGRIASLLPPGQAKTRYHGFHRLGSADAAPKCPESGETFASQALDGLREKLASSGARAARVVLVSDVSGECKPLLCDAAQRLTSSGTWLDLVQIGPGTPPQCIQELRISEGTTPAFLGAGEPPKFRVESLESSATARSVLARGSAQGPPVAVNPGLRMIVVELSPEEQVGPVLLQDGQRTRVRLMEFPLSAPGKREWVVEVER
jgi:hypothetical protein